MAASTSRGMKKRNSSSIAKEPCLGCNPAVKHVDSQKNENGDHDKDAYDNALLLRQRKRVRNIMYVLFYK